MPNYMEETVYRFCTKAELYSFYLQNKEAYKWIATHSIDSTTGINPATFRAVLAFMDNGGRTPEGIKGMQNYILHNPSGIDSFEKASIAEEDLRDLEDFESDETLDDHLLFDSLLAHTRESWLANQFQVAGNIATGAMKTPDKSKASGASAAITWIRSELTHDFSKETPALSGMLHENIPTVLKGLDDKLKPEDTNDRFPLGFWHIDKAVKVGKKNLRFIGVVGKSGDGKTTLTHQIVYNWLRQGAHILYCSTEHNPEEIWEFMAFLHQSHPDYPFTLPSLHEWENRDVTPEDQGNMYKVLADIQERKNLPGLLDTQSLRNWDAIKDYLTLNHAKNKYDILVVDYIGRLDMPSDPRVRDGHHASIVTDAQGLSRSFDNGKGLVILTPIQVNREAHKSAKKTEEGGHRYDLNAIARISEYEHHLDLALSVFSDEHMKIGDQIEVDVIKKRKGRQPATVTMNIAPASGAFMYMGETPELKEMWDTTADDVMDAEAKTSTINADSWGI